MSPFTMEPTTSEDVHHSAVLSAIIQPIKDLSENFKVDLSMHLQTYLHELYEQQKKMRSVNFVEAALLIQRSAGIFVKKVDYLWTLLFQVLESLRKKGVSEEKTQTKRKRGVQSSELFEDFIEIPVNPDKKTWKEKGDAVKLDPPYYSELEYNCPRDKNLGLFDHMMDPVGDKSDFRLNYQISNKFMLVEELSILDTLENDNITTDVANGDHEHREYDGVDMDDSLADNGCENNDPVGPDHMETEPEPEPEPEPVLSRVNRAGLQAENREKIVAVNPVASIDVWDSEAGSIPDKSVKVQERCKLPCEVLEKKKKGMLDSSLSSLVTDNVAVNFGSKFQELPKFQLECLKVSRNKKAVKGFQKTEEVEEYRKTLASDFPNDFLGFVDLEGLSADEDAEFVGFPDQEDDDQDDHLDPFPDNVDSPLPNVSNAGENNEWGQVYQSILQEKMHSARVDHQDAQAALASRVNQWHDSIRAKLKGAEERKCMDIHEYETRILDTFPQVNGKRMKTTIDFAEVVKDEEQEEICRYFLASLLLANNYNVEISVSDQRELAMDCMELTLLKTTRHHENLEEYQAPSQVARRSN